MDILAADNDNNAKTQVVPVNKFLTDGKVWI